MTMPRWQIRKCMMSFKQNLVWICRKDVDIIKYNVLKKRCFIYMSR